MFSTPTKSIEFHYAGFGGDYDIRSDADLFPLSFEADLTLEEERAVSNAKKRYCLFRKQNNGKVVLEIRKSPSIAPNQPLIIVNQVLLSKNRKGRSVLEVTYFKAKSADFLLCFSLYSRILELYIIFVFQPVNRVLQLVEPLFVRLFLFDARSGKRISEEFRVSPRYGESDAADDNEFEDLKSTMICSVAQPHRDIYVVARIERILSPDHSGEIYTKTNADSKTLSKLIKNVQAAASKLCKFRMPFAWAIKFHKVLTFFYRPTFQEMLGGSTKIQEDNPLYRWDGNKMADSDLQKVLNDLANEKSGKTSIIPGSSISLSVDISAKINDNTRFAVRISPSYTAIQPWNTLPETSPCFEVQPFSDTINEPYTNLVNNLYVYPLLLKYDGQKVFTKARNIACTVQFVASAERTRNSKAIYDRFAHPIPFVSKIRCTVQHHEQNPAFADEIKIQLPLGLDPSDHLLFSFSHIAVSAAVQKPNEPFEIPIGYSWLPLVKNDRLVMENDEQEVALPVAADLPEGYITYQSLGLGKGHIGPEVRWVEGGKPLFRVRLRLVSSVFTTETRLQSFFQGCQKLQAIGLNLSSRTPSALLEVEIDRLVPFLPLILSRLLLLLPNCTTDEMAITLVYFRTLIGVVDRAVVAGRSPLINSFVKNHLHSSGMKLAGESDEETTYSAICKYATILVRNFIVTLATIFRQLGFLLDVAAKSMAQKLMDTELYKEPRRKRFSENLCSRIKNFIEQVVPLLVMKHREIPVETRLANSAIAYFLRCCLSFLDRGSVFSWIHYTVTKFDEADSRLLREYKLDLLQILAGHEHWLPLALPLLCDSAGDVIKLDESVSSNRTDFGKLVYTFLIYLFNDIFTMFTNFITDIHYMDEFTLTEGYCTRHFLTGLLLQELQCAFREPREYRRRAIALVRNVLAKHSIDKRYRELRSQTRIATLYIPLLRIVLDNLGELDPSLSNFENSIQSAAGPQMGSGQSSLFVFQLIRNSFFESRDLLLSVVYVLYRMPRKVFEALLLDAEGSGSGLIDFVRLLELVLEFFKYRGMKFTLSRTSGKRFLKTGPLEALSLLIEALLLQLNSRMISIQTSAASILHIILKSGYEDYIQSEQNGIIRVADLHIQLADSYRGSAALRSAWFDTLAETHIHDRWYPEAAICEMHVLAIMAKELSSSATFDWGLFSAGNDCIASEEDVYGDERNVEKAGFTIRNFTAKVEKTIQTLVLAERYEAIGFIILFVYTQSVLKFFYAFLALVSMYVELQQAYSLADQVKITGKRHLGAYFRVFFFSSTFFGDEHKTEWIYREPGLTSLAEAYERMTKSCRLALGHEKVQIIPEKEIDEEKLDKDCAYIQMTHVEPVAIDGDKTSFEAHTNLRRFMYESNDVDTTVPEDAPNLARQALKKVYLTSELRSSVSPFPNTCRRQRVDTREEEFMNPLELAVDKLTFKADQITRLDVKGLQLLLQGAVQPTVNVGPLAYAEAFTAPEQRERYGDEGVMRLAMAFRKLMTVCADALQVNEAAISSDQAEYQQMLKDGYVAMMERLNSYFGDMMSLNPSNNRKSKVLLNAIGGLKE
uniref:C2 DOCK-type domain-containing protein n=1 Tax=Syphacia muris TaxID=451379 RepID=A0A158R4T4_9BILA